MAQAVMDSGATADLAALDAALQAELGVAPADDLAALFAATSASRCRLAAGQALRFGGYLDLRPALLVVVPPPHGVLGLVYALPEQAEGFVAAATSAVEDAVQLRQLLLEEAEPRSQRALQVELVLLVPAATGSAERNALADEFNHIARQTSYVRLIGLNVLTLPAQGAIERAALRRAFCWLLCETRAWFRHMAASVAAEPPRPWELRLTDYRLAGERRFRFDAGVGRLHLVHGHNGSGKSTLVEAIELLLTRRIQRLDKGGQSPYYPALRHRPRSAVDLAAGDACAELRIADSPVARCVINPAGLDFEPVALAVTPRVHSFRIDQPFMNDLIRADQAGRAQLFLEAFAPADTALLADVANREQAFEQAWAKLPAALWPADTSADLAQRLRWCAEQLAPLLGALPSPDAAPGPGWAGLLPVARTDLELLAKARPALKALMAQLSSLPPGQVQPELPRLDDELIALREALPAMLADLRLGLRVLQEFEGWQATGQVQRGVSHQHDLQRWMELRALVDLAGKYGDVLATLQRAAELGWRASPDDLAALPGAFVDATTTAAVRQRRDELRQQLNDARERLRTWQAGAASGEDSGGVATPAYRRSLAAAEQAALDRIGPWLPSASSPEPLGRQFAAALAGDHAVTLAASVIGTAQGLAPLLAEAQALIAAGERVQQVPKSSWVGAERAGRRLKAALELAGELRTARDSLAGSFFQQLAAVDAPGNEDAQLTQRRLQAAVNELLALATPARWNYSDVGLRTTVQGSRPSLGFSAQGDTRADLLLNTAELSAFTLVLFLLLAPRVDNPLRLLVLDDPLQNMDEMMVCTLARALAGLVAVFPPGWSVLALFHGMDDMERVREEAPSAVYHLPWARPLGASGAQGEIGPLPALGTWQRVAQSLDERLLSLSANA